MDPAEVAAFRAKVAQRAAEDPEFKAALLANPMGAISKEYNFTFPDSIDPATFNARVRSRFQTGANPDRLSNTELEQVAGGAPKELPPCGY